MYKPPARKIAEAVLRRHMRFSYIPSDIQKFRDTDVPESPK